MATTHIDYRKIDYDQLLDKPIIRTDASVDTLTTAGVYDKGDGKRYIVSVSGQNITQVIEEKDGYQTRSSTDGGTTWGAWETVEFSKSGDIDAEDVNYDNTTSELQATNVQAAIDEMNEVVEEIKDIVEVEEMPTPSEDIEGTIIQYKGATTSTFTHGYFYECVGDGQNPETFSRVRIDVQPNNAIASSVSYDNTTSGMVATNVQDAIDEIDTSVDTINTTITNIQSDITDIKNIVEVETMDTPSEDNEGSIVQYKGATNANFTHGYFYECVGDGGNPETFSWVRIDVQPAGAGDEHEFITQAAYDLLTPAQKAEKVYMITGEGETGGGGDDSSIIHLDKNGEEDGTVQSKINDMQDNEQTLINKVNYLEINGGFFPLIADNIIYSGSSFSYLAEEDTLLYISDTSDTYLKIDGGNIGGQYSPGYIHVAEGQTITYSRNCKVYKANNTLVIDDTDVTLGLMDDKYLGPVNYQDNQVSAINSAHLGNNKVATATGTGDLEFHFNHEFNTQHSKMDEAELVVSGNLTYGDMGTINNLATFDGDFVGQTTLNIDVAKNGYYEENGTKYAIHINNLRNPDIGYSRLQYDIDILELDNNLNVVNTTNKNGYFDDTNLGGGGGRKVWGNHILVNQWTSPTSYTCLDVVNGELEKHSYTDLLYINGEYSGISIFDSLMYKGNWYNFGGVSRYSSGTTKCCVSKRDVYGTVNSIYSFGDYYGSLSVLIDTNNDYIYIIFIRGRYDSVNHGPVCVKYDINTSTTTTLDPNTFNNRDDILGKCGYCTVDNNNNIIINTLLGGNIIEDKKTVNKGTVYITELNNDILYTAEKVMLPSTMTGNGLTINSSSSQISAIVGVNSDTAVDKIIFNNTSFSSTDTVDIDITIKNNSGESRTVTLPKSGWSTSNDTTTGTGTTFTFNS